MLELVRAVEGAKAVWRFVLQRSEVVDTAAFEFVYRWSDEYIQTAESSLQVTSELLEMHNLHGIVEHLFNYLSDVSRLKIKGIEFRKYDLMDFEDMLDKFNPNRIVSMQFVK